MHCYFCSHGRGPTCYSFAFCDRVRLGKPRVLFQKGEELAGKMAEESPLISAEFLAELSAEVQKIELLC